MAGLGIELVPMRNDNYAFLVHEPEQGVTAAIDSADAAPMLARLQARGLKLDWVLTTHKHADHVGGNLELKRATGCRIAGPRAEAAAVPGIDVELGEGDRFALGGEEARVYDTPGHTSGHICYWFAGAKALFCGDLLFVMGCGRVFEASHAVMWSSLSKLAAMPDDTRVYCGHEYTLANARFALTIEPDNAALVARAAEMERLRAEGRPTVPSTLGEERATNPFLRVREPGIRRHLGMEGASDAEVFAEIRTRKDRA